MSAGVVAGSAEVRPGPLHLIDRLHGLVHDHERVGLRRGLRAALVVTVSFGVLTLLGANAQLSTFVNFGLIALLIMADFGGPTPTRARAYVMTWLIGSLAIVVASLVSRDVWLSSLAMGLFAFVVTFACVFGGYVVAARTALLLSFVLAVTGPVSPSEIPTRVLGWTIAGVIALAAALLLWPAHIRGALRRYAAKACLALARMVRAGADTGSVADVRQQLATAGAEITRLRTMYATTQHRPAGLAQQDRALAELVANLDRTIALFGQQDAAAAAHWGPPRNAAKSLADAVANVLDRSAATLVGTGSSPDVEQLAQAQTSHVTALGDWAGAELRGGTDVESVLRGLELAHPIRLLSYLAYEIGASATVLGAGEQTAPAWLAELARARSETATHLHLRSIWVRSGLRAGVALGLSVLVARLTGVDHAFWVVLGTLSVLRGSASATGRTSLQSFVGTVIGFILATTVMLAGGSNPVVLWIALPICLFLAGYTPTAVHYVVGQAAFTLLVVVLFNLIAFEGVHVGIVRVQDVALGIGVSLVSGFLLWPRGPRAQLPGALAALYRCCAAYLEVSMGSLFGRTPDTTALAASRQAASDQDERSGEVFSQLLEQPGSRPGSPPGTTCSQPASA